jgi:hypothetical protein
MVRLGSDMDGDPIFFTKFVLVCGHHAAGYSEPGGRRTRKGPGMDVGAVSTRR